MRYEKCTGTATRRSSEVGGFQLNILVCIYIYIYIIKYILYLIYFSKQAQLQVSWRRWRTRFAARGPKLCAGTGLCGFSWPPGGLHHHHPPPPTTTYHHLPPPTTTTYHHHRPPPTTNDKYDGKVEWLVTKHIKSNIKLVRLCGPQQNKENREYRPYKNIKIQELKDQIYIQIHSCFLLFFETFEIL